MRTIRILLMLEILMFSFLAAEQQNFTLILDSSHSNPLIKVRADAQQYADHVELTKVNGKNSTGRLYYTKAVHLAESCKPNKLLSFSTSFTFQFVKIGTYEQGHGMAFCITYGMPEPPISSTGGGLGMINMFANKDTTWFFAVEFDTIQNFEFNDPERPHVGIDINSLQSVAIVVPSDDLALDMNYTLTAWVDYIAPIEEVQIRLARNTTKPANALLRSTISNLTDVIQDTMYLGFSAGTGNRTELHRIYAWNFSVSDSAVSDCSAGEPKCRLSMPVMTMIIILSLITCSCVMAVAWLWHKLMKSKIKHIMPAPITSFTYKELRAATKNFSRHNLLGKGGFGCVYRGDLATGVVVAVKVLSQNTEEMELQCVAELSVISHLRHRNLLSLTGWCHEKGKLLLVYDYMPNGSLDKCLFEASYVLPWQQRYNIVVGVAEGLSFLHHGWEQKVVHRDVKASNVLLDCNYVSHLGDFGLAKLMDSDRTETDMTMIGTRGYIAPELFTSDKASEKSDVYGFGVLILEIGTGKRVMDSNLPLPLVDWVWSLKEENNLLDVVDSKLEALFDEVQMTTVLLLGLLCCQENPHHRPSMRRCCNILKADEARPTVPAFQSIARSNRGEFPLLAWSSFSQSVHQSSSSNAFSGASNT